MGVIPWPRYKPNFAYVSYNGFAEAYVISSIQYTAWLLLSQRIMNRLCLSTASGRLGSFVAALFIGTGNVLSSLTLSYSAKYFSGPCNSKIGAGFFIPNKFSIIELVVIFLAGILFYKIFLFEKFFRILPSSLYNPGAFSNTTGRLPVQLSQIITSNNRRFIEKMGNIYGCHSCGIKNSDFIVDHIPPSSIVRNNLKNLQQHVYPQCASCSHKQCKFEFI